MTTLLLRRTTTLADGGQVCDFRCKKGRAVVQGWDAPLTPGSLSVRPAQTFLPQPACRDQPYMTPMAACPHAPSPAPSAGQRARLALPAGLFYAGALLPAPAFPLPGRN